MGLLNKIKNMFTEEVEVEVEQPIKKEVIQVEIPAPAKQEKKEIIPKEIKEEKIVVTDSPALKQDEKNKFPIFFDDDFEVLEKKEKVVKQEKKEIPKIVEKPVLPPYGIKVHRFSDNADINIDIENFSHFLEYSEDDEFKPYLRPLSSMTDDDKKKYQIKADEDKKRYEKEKAAYDAKISGEKGKKK